LKKKLRLLSSAPSLATAKQTQRRAETQTFRSKLQLVDLAGSECVGMSGATGTALRESQCINKSLSALSDVLTSLSQHKSHTPYRNSTLTHLLQSSIGGDAKLLVLLCISPSQRYLGESQRCLQFGSRARQIQRGATKAKFLPKQGR
jgi:kinesin family protein 25